MRATRLLPLLLAAAACGPTFTPRSVLFDLRVLAIRATPLEVGPAESVTLDAVRLPPPGGAIESEEWTFCPFSIGSSAGYACAVPACEFPLTPTGAASQYVSAPVTANPGQLAEDCLALLAGAGALPQDLPAQVPDRLDVLFRYVVHGPDGAWREAVQRVPLYTRAPPAERNVPPVISSVTIGGLDVQPYGGADPTLRSSALDVRVLLAPGSAQTYVEAGRTLTEQLVVSFYTTAGRFDYDWANGPDASVELQPEDVVPGTDEAQVWAVARDLRGGQTVAGPFHVNVETSPPPLP